MASLRLSCASDFCEPRKCNPFGFEFCLLDFIGYSSRAPHVYRGFVVHRNSVVRRNGIKCRGFFGNTGLDSGTTSGGLVGGHARAFVRLKRIRVVDLKEAGGSYPVSDLDEECKSDEVTGEASDDSATLPKDAVYNLVELQRKVPRNNVGRKNGRKLWGRLVAAEKEIPGGIPAPASVKRERFKFVQEDAELKAYLSALGPQTTVEQCNSILKLLDQSSGEKMLNFFEWMRSNGKVKQNTAAYITALKALVRKGDWGTVEKLFQEMISAGCELNCQVFNKLIFVCSKRGIVEMGAKLFRMMLDKGILPDIPVFGMLMTLYQKGGNLNEAEFTFNKMRSCKVRCVTAYSAMITIYTRIGQYDKSEGIIRIMDGDGVQPIF